MYGREPEPLASLIPRFAGANAKLADDYLRNHYVACIELLELQYRLASECMGMLLHGAHIHGRPQIQIILMNAFHTNLFSFWSALDLTRQGFYGPARPVLRLIYEAQLIAKFCSVHSDVDLYQRWEKGDPYIFLSKHVFKRTKSPHTQPLETVWGDLCNFTHFSTFSGQVGLRISSHST